MYFVNRGYSSFLILAAILLGVFLLFQFLPFIILAVAIGAAIRYSYRYLKTWNLNRGSKVKTEKGDSFSEQNGENYEFNNSNVIDVEYTEVK